MPRLFIAIECTKNIAEYLLDVQKSINTEFARITLTKSFHLTLKFLGETQIDIEEIISRLSQIRQSRFNLTLNKLGVFPNENYINVVWVGIKEYAEVKPLQEAVENSLINLFPNDKFHPHITLGRVKYIINKNGFIELLRDVKIRDLSFRVEEFKLYESILLSGGPEYKVIQEFKLKTENS